MMHFQLKRAKEMAQTCWRHRNEGEEGTRSASESKLWKCMWHVLIQPACTSLSLPVKFISDTVQWQLKVLWQPMASDLQETFSVFHKANIFTLWGETKGFLWNPEILEWALFSLMKIRITVNYQKATFLDCLPYILNEAFRNVLAC